VHLINNPCKMLTILNKILIVNCDIDVTTKTGFVWKVNKLVTTSLQCMLWNPFSIMVLESGGRASVNGAVQLRSLVVV